LAVLVLELEQVMEPELVLVLELAPDWVLALAPEMEQVLHRQQANSPLSTTPTESTIFSFSPVYLL